MKRKKPSKNYFLLNGIKTYISHRNVTCLKNKMKNKNRPPSHLMEKMKNKILPTKLLLPKHFQHPLNHCA